MTLERFLLIADIQTYVFAIGAVLCLWRYKSRNSYIKVLGFALVWSVFCDRATYVFHNLKWPPNYPGSLYAFFALPFISVIYSLVLGGRKRVFTGITLIYMAFAACMFFQEPTGIPSKTYTLAAIIVVGYSLYFFYWLLRELPTTQIQRLPMFWINSAYLIFHSGNLFLFVFTSHLVHVLNNNMLVYWTLHNLIGIIEGVMLIVGIWMDLRNIKSPSSSQ